ncbi:protein of unknown function [Arenibacter nanhaiticus]|uniref:3-keto-alpha-glucoside-1,2-lyase/3-keto-2-hydroxy-glucal hydratase domain-containing protein n=1 Tax=Arenibacter nanhaiticus TaxID=558155 RepID=A0A1M6LG38_9FLAO|nr:DUF1080 domain-containing protein [Arenibacter nanhaiticus]SHJ70203.1 protein of unknown function [Arenibacter nanhaiticus]
MKKFFSMALYSACLLILCQCTTLKPVAQEQNGEWVHMFNGKDLNDWTTKIHHYEVGDNYGDTFRVEDSIIKVRYDKYEGDFNERYGHLYYNTPYSYYHLVIEYRFVGELHPGAPGYTIKNSGVMFHSQDPRTMLKEQDWPISVEMQFLAGLEEGSPRPTGNMCSPGTDVVYEGKIDPRHCINSTSKTYYGDQWVRAEAIVLGDSLVTHIINGEKVLEYTQPQIGGGVANGYDPAVKIDGTLLKEGFIALQSEGQPIDFRMVKIKNLKGCMDPKAINFHKDYIKSDPEACIYK